MNVIVGGRQSGKTTALVAAAKAALARGDAVIVFVMTKARRRQLVEVHELPEEAIAVAPRLNAGVRRELIENFPCLPPGQRSFMALDDADEFLAHIFGGALDVVTMTGESSAVVRLRVGDQAVIRVGETERSLH